MSSIPVPRDLWRRLVATLGLTAVAIVPLAAAAEPTTGEALRVEIVATDVSGDDTYAVGDRIGFEYRVTNLTDENHSTELVDSNLDGDAGCKWRDHPAGATQVCTFPTHTVTQADLDAGTFTPEATWQIYTGTGYEGEILEQIEVTADPVTILPTAPDAVEITAGEHTNPQESYQAGDRLEFSIPLTNRTDEALTISPDYDQANAFAPGELDACAGEIPANATRTCTGAFHEVTAGDLDARYFEPTSSWQVLATDGTVLQALTVPVAPVALLGELGEAAPDYDAEWGDEPFYAETQLATHGEGGFPNYRIPALTVTNDGDLLASYDGRPTGIDAPGPNSILQRRSTDNGQTWQPVTTVAAGHGDPDKEGYSDPSYIVDRITGDVFNFHVYSQDAGFRNSQPGTDVDDRNVLHANLSHSTDGGQTWTERTITAQITDDIDWRSRFAASGQGIQLKYGEHAGRLIQQFLIINEDVGGGYQALSVYSDDHGATWHAGEPVGTSMDENKTVELSDGRVMMNSRDSGGSGYRKVAYSTDGGVTYSEPQIDRELPDPTNNGSIIRAFPNAEQGSPEAQVLLFSNASSQTSRSHGVVRMSCDDGESWPISREFREGSMSYSTLATLPDGSIGLLYEPDDGIRFATFNLAWLGGVCAGIEVEGATGQAGDVTDVDVTVTNQLGQALQDVQVGLDLPSGWSAEPVTIEDLAAGAATTVTIPVSVPGGAHAGTYTLAAVISTAQGESRRDFTFDIPAGPDAVVTIVGQLTGTPEEHLPGSRLDFTYRVTNVSNQVLAIVPTSAELAGFTRPGNPNCGWSALQPGESYTCTTAHRVLTDADLATGVFSPQTSWEVRAGGYDGEVVATVERDAPAVQLNVPANLIPQSEISVADVSSAETTHADSPAANTLDGDPATIWHTDWSLTEGPHWITLDLGEEYQVRSLRYLPRTEGGTNGTLREYEVYLSNDGAAWGEPLATGTLDLSSAEHVIEVPEAPGRYLKLVYVTSYSDSGRHFASAAELNVQGVRSPAAAVEVLRASLQEYVASGEVDGPIARKLARAVDQVGRHLENERTTPAVRAAERFIRHLDNPTRRDTLSDAASADLRAQAEAVLERIG